MLTATGFTPLLVNLENVISNPNAGGGSKDCVTWKVEEAVHFSVHTDKVTTDCSTDKAKELQPQGRCLIWDVAQPHYKLYREFLNTF